MPVIQKSRCVRVVSAGAELRDSQTVVYSPHPGHVPADIVLAVEALPPQGAHRGQLRGGLDITDKSRIIRGVEEDSPPLRDTAYDLPELDAVVRPHAVWSGEDVGVIFLRPAEPENLPVAVYAILALQRRPPRSSCRRRAYG